MAKNRRDTNCFVSWKQPKYDEYIQIIPLIEVYDILLCHLPISDIDDNVSYLTFYMTLLLVLSGVNNLLTHFDVEWNNPEDYLYFCIKFN